MICDAGLGEFYQRSDRATPTVAELITSIFTEKDLSRIATAYRIRRATMSIVKQNLAWAFVYNIIGIPLAMAGIHLGGQEG